MNPKSRGKDMVWAIMSLKRTAAKKIFVTAAKNNRHRKRKYFADLKTKKNYCRRICFYFPINSGPKQRKWERKTAKLLGRKN